MQKEDLQDNLNRLLSSKPETGEQWAEICRIEAQLAKNHPEIAPPIPYQIKKDLKIDATELAIEIINSGPKGQRTLLESDYAPGIEIAFDAAIDFYKAGYLEAMKTIKRNH